MKQTIYAEVFRASQNELWMEQILPMQGIGPADYIYGSNIFMPRELVVKEGPYFNKNVFIEEGSRIKIEYNAKEKHEHSGALGILRLKQRQIIAAEVVGRKEHII
ncbi:MAG: hypothetical protein LBG89_02855 [Rickettsiales bacterium]|jgi:hypothetical protein|nr:hypothetical protein [Rickettsiales bacterium]